MGWGMGWIDLAHDYQLESFCECGNELSVSINGREFLDYLRTCFLLNKDFSMNLVYYIPIYPGLKLRRPVFCILPPYYIK